MKRASLKKADMKTPMEDLKQTTGFHEGEPVMTLALPFAPYSISLLCVLLSSLGSLTGPFLFFFPVSLDRVLSVTCVICCTNVGGATLSLLRLSQWLKRFIKQTHVQQSSIFKLTSIPFSISSSSGPHTAHKFHPTTLVE